MAGLRPVGLLSAIWLALKQALFKVGLKLTFWLAHSRKDVNKMGLCTEITCLAVGPASSFGKRAGGACGPAIFKGMDIKDFVEIVILRNDH